MAGASTEVLLFRIDGAGAGQAGNGRGAGGLGQMKALFKIHDWIEEDQSHCVVAVEAELCRHEALERMSNQNTACLRRRTG
jgi:hypothetical protein